MRKDKVKAYELRRQEKSYSEISKILKIPKSTLATWFKNQDWSRDIRNKLGSTESLAYPKKLALIIKATKDRWSKIHQNYRNQAVQEFDQLKQYPLFIAGVMLYWGEGDKGKGPTVKFANSDPRMMKIFYQFLIKILAVPSEKIHAYLLLYPDLKDEMQKTFWHRATGIPTSQFWNSIYITGKHPTHRLSYGVCYIHVGSRQLKERLLTWINLFEKEFV